MPACSTQRILLALPAQTLDSLATQPLKEIADMLARGGINQQKRAVKIQNWLALDPGRQPAELGMLARAFLTDEGQPQKRLSDKQIDADFPDSVEMQMLTLQSYCRAIRPVLPMRCVLS